MKLTNLNIPARFIDGDLKDKEVARFRINYPNCVCFKQNYETEAELDRDKKLWDMTYYDMRLLANELSLRLFGSRNEDRYPILKAKFDKKDIKNKDIPITYSPSQKVYNEEVFPDYDETFKSSMRISEKWNTPFRYLRVIEESEDILEKLYLIESMQKLDTGNSRMASEVKKYALSLKEDILERPSDELYPIGYCSKSFFTPKEIEDNMIESVDKSWLENFKIMCYGFRIDNLDESNYSNFKPKNSDISERLNKAIFKEVFENREFIDLSKTNSYGVITEDTAQNIKGISIFFDHFMEDDKLITKIGIGLDTNSDKIYEFTNGKIGRLISIDEFTRNSFLPNNHKEDFLVVYFLPLSDELYNKVSDKIKDMNVRNYHIKNFIIDACDKLGITYPGIMNDKLFYVYLIHLLISMSTDIEVTDRLPELNKKVYSYILYKGESNDYNSKEVFSKLNLYASKLIDKSDLQEGYFRMKKIDMQILLESDNNTSIDRTNLNRVNYNDFVNTLSKFSID